MQLPETIITTLSSGLRLVHCHQTSEVEYFGAAINAGSRDDPEGFYGLAHFVEHVLFKGTTHRKSWHIINRMESCGGELNAYTTKETTVVYTVYPKGNFTRAAELVADLLCNSVFPPSELDKEREVVADEIFQYRDMPSEAVYDDFEDLLFKGSSLGHNILGTQESLQRFDSETCRNYLRNNFSATRMVLFYSGNLPVEKVVKSVERYFSELPDNKNRISRTPPPAAPLFNKTTNLGNHQSNTVIGARIPSLHSPDRIPFALLANIIGGPGMNSLLNVELRERRGLVYAVEASAAFLSDTGLMTIYFGCDHEDTLRCCRLAEKTIRRIADGALNSRFIAAAKRQYIGQLTLAADLRENSVMSMARAALYHGRLFSRSQTTEAIEAITADDLCRCATTLLNPGLSTLTLS